ncbi:MAG: class I SAM-dependent methyltransferase [Alphaproteobacteria bacterium]|nr:class I SAM-dependent methyltransferase [Alphaproteobacteria bacterium]
MSRKVLLFPALLLEAVRIKVLAAERGETVIAAATSVDESGLKLFPQHVMLPHLTDAEFKSALRALLVSESIAHIYSPHARCYHEISLILKEEGLPVTLSSGMQQLHAALIYDGLRAAAAPVHASYANRPMRRAAMPLDHLVALLHVVTPIVGQSHFLKLATLAMLAADFPEGDCIEIGVAAGRSLVFFSLLMQYYHLGVTVGIDPWTNFSIKQDVSSLDAKMLEEQAVWDRGVQTLHMTLLPYARQDLAFVRQTSAEAYQHYASQRLMGTQPLGPIQTAGRIGVLHVDGNHTEEKATEDLALWTPHLVPGAWVIVDDYLWDYGDGPRLAIDAWLKQNASRVAEHFVVDKAKFVKMK